MTALEFLYNKAIGRVFLKALASRSISVFCGKILDSSISKPLIKSFVKNNNINLEEYEKTNYSCFNDFFTRKIKSELRPIGDDENRLKAPCDGLLSVYKIENSTVLPIKQSSYTIASLLRSNELAEEYKNGWCYVFRLGVQNYHRYSYPCICEENEHRFIKGKLHTVQPIALEKYPVFVENCREYTVLKTNNFGSLVQIEVGAMLVGKIKNHHPKGEQVCGAEKGMFLYGGSTIVVLASENSPKPKNEFLEAKIELPIKLGEYITE